MTVGWGSCSPTGSGEGRRRRSYSDTALDIGFVDSPSECRAAVSRWVVGCWGRKSRGSPGRPDSCWNSCSVDCWALAQLRVEGADWVE